MTDTSTCEAEIGQHPDDTETCGRPNAKYVTIGCVHEHINSLYVCSACIIRVVKCMTCDELGHDCPMLSM